MVDQNGITTVESIDERLLAMAINRVAGARSIFKTLNDVHIQGEQNKAIFNATNNIFLRNKSVQIIGMDLVVAELQSMGKYKSIDASKIERINSFKFNPKDLNMVIDTLKKRKKESDLDRELSRVTSGEISDPEKRKEFLKNIANIESQKDEFTGSKILGFDEWMEAINHIELLPDSVQTGFPILDEQLGGGLIQGGYHIISAPSSHGKTILMLSMWKNMIDSDIPAIYMNYEIARDLFMKFMFAQFTGINVMRRDNDPIEVEAAKKKMLTIVHDLLDRGLLLLTDPMQEAPKMWNGIKDMLVDVTEETGAKVVFVDTINSIGAVTKTGQSQRWNEYEEMAREAEAMTQSLNIALVMSAQQDQNSVKRDDRTPQLMDVAGSKTLTEKASSVIHLHRIDLLDKTKRIDYSELHVTKNRVTGTEFGRTPIRIKYDLQHKSLRELPLAEQETDRVLLDADTMSSTFISTKEATGVRKHPKLNISEGVEL